MKTHFLKIGLLILILLVLSCANSDRSLNILNPNSNEASKNISYKHSIHLNPETPVEFSIMKLGYTETVSTKARATSYLAEDLTREASVFDKLLSSKSEAVGSNMSFTPEWLESNPDPTGIAYAMYSINLMGYDKEPTIKLKWALDNAPKLWKSDEGKKTPFVWIALGNVDDASKKYWDWYSIDESLNFSDPDDLSISSIVTISNPDNKKWSHALTRYIEESTGKLSLVVLVLGSKPATLDKIMIGDLAVVTTGLDYIVPTPDAEPQLYTSNNLPSNYDLAILPKLHQPRQQSPWGSCTTFAIGDGAYNLELARIYNESKWDSSQNFNQIGPKYIYTETGDKKCGPTNGRGFSDVLERMKTDLGAATEKNAPYDISNCNRIWSADAKTDASLLKIDGYKYINCDPSTVLVNFKQLLYNQQPVIMATKCDDGIFNYKTGQVWNYIGPVAGYHAMCVVGWDDSKNAFKVRNSWGPKWGNNGYLWIDYKTFQNPDAGVYAAILWDTYDSDVAKRFCKTFKNLIPPKNVTADKGISDTGINIKWSKVNGAKGYKVYRDTQAEPPIKTILDFDTWFDDQITDEKTHTYWVKAYSDTEESNFSAPTWGYKKTSGSSMNEKEPNNYSNESNTVLSIPMDIKGSVGTSDTADWFEFTATNKDIYTFTLNYDPSKGNAGLKLYDFYPSTLQSDTTTNSGKKVLNQGLKSGKHFIVVTNIAQSTDYTLSITSIASGYDENEDNDYTNEATLVNLPLTSFKGSIGDQSYDGDGDITDNLSFNVEDGEYIKATLKNVNKVGNLYFKLLDSEGYKLYSDIDGTSFERFINIGLKKGTYYFQIYSPNAVPTSIEYNLVCSLSTPGYNEIEDNDDTTSATVINLPVTDYYGSVGDQSYNGDQTDYLAFNVSDGQYIKASLNNVNKVGNLYFKLLDSEGFTISSNLDGVLYDRKINIGLKKGTYCFRIYSSTEIDDCIDYKLSCTLETPGYDEFEDNDDINTGNVLPAFPVSNFFGSVGVESYDGGNKSSDNSDYFVFNLASPKTVSVDLSYNNLEGGNIYLYIVDSSGFTLSSDISGNPGTRKCSKSLSAGNYGIRVRAYTGGSEYHFNVTAN